MRFLNKLDFRLFFSLDLEQPNLTVFPSKAVNENDGVILKCSTKGTNSITYTWYKDGKQIENKDNILMLANVKRENKGNYYCIASSDLFNKTSNTLSMEIKCNHNYFYYYCRCCFVLVLDFCLFYKETLLVKYKRLLNPLMSYSRPLLLVPWVFEKIFSFEMVKNDICLGGASKQIALSSENMP